MRKIFFAIPSHSGFVPVPTMMSLIQSINDLGGLGFTVTVECWAGDSLIPHARNVLISKFLASDCTDLVCIDSDIVWDTEAITRLLSHRCDFVAGMYRFKNEEENYPFRYGKEVVTVINPETGEPASV